MKSCSEPSFFHQSIVSYRKFSAQFTFTSFSFFVTFLTHVTLAFRTIVSKKFRFLGTINALAKFGTGFRERHLPDDRNKLTL